MKKHPLIKSSIIYVLSDSINKAIPFLLLPILTVYLSPSEYGIVANFNIFKALVLILFGLNGSSLLGVKFYSTTRKNITDFIGTMIVISTLIFIILLILILFSSNFIFNITGITKNWQIIALAVSFSQAITLINLSIWRLENKPVNFALYEFLQALLNTTLTVVLVIMLNQGLNGRLFAMSFTFIGTGFISILILRYRNYFRLSLSKALILPIISFTLPLVPHGLSGWARSSIDRFVIMNKSGPEELGLYSAAFQLAMALSFLTMAFNRAYGPYIYEKLSKDREKDKLKLVKITYFYIVLVLAITSFLWLLEYWFITEFLDKRYIMSIRFIPWLIFGFSFQGMYYMVVPYFYHKHKTTWVALITTSVTLIHISMVYYLVPIYGAIAAAKIFLVSNIILFLLTWFFSTRLVPMPWKLIFKTDHEK